ncbi:threonylcarbamoyl-AMP synthase [Nocardiopsis terrae]|uniref:L-threonylcarbamoyladenylate synthase n=1 Tax=Nocardiopsis terrae TaxID=372655 RepID=A0ABR9HLA3_9ACTN|nr:L-threonylcarbamoyladenylate synthase [Nocardiopsis terrae]MBE1459758.1 tRNA threonylcarbamoyl adenosine modification protein (Sua5/YciO/YrdC/YwlC family) [Nocardiopsis terrae]GHC94130.1 threonylcarbamoyl-AMP synthase [Nocardiopsis terrae]
MSRIYDCADETARKDGIADAASAVRRGDLVVLPTDTVYGIGTDAFSPKAVANLLETKGRGRDMPPPVLVGSIRAATALIDDLGNHGRDLMEEFWPGPLTLVCTATPSLSWDLGDTKGTVAVRMPMDPVALELLKETGPMAVSSANKSGQPAAATAGEAIEQLGDEDVAVYLDGGESESPVASTIVDLTYAVPRVLRSGAISIERLRAVCGTVIGELRKGRTKPRKAEDEDTEAAGGPGTEDAAQAGAVESEAAESAAAESGDVKTGDAGTDATGPGTAEADRAGTEPEAAGPEGTDRSKS